MPPINSEIERVCLFGGTFDPIHTAHLRIASEAAKAFSLSRVLFVPAANPPHKESATISPYEDRYRMVELACFPYPTFEASRLEEGAGTSFTIDTLNRFAPSLTPGTELLFLIGSDAFEEIQTWRCWQDVVRLTGFIVVTRPGYIVRDVPGARVYRLEHLALPISSSDIRDRLKAGESTPELAPPVRDYIEDHGLYGATALR